MKAVIWFFALVFALIFGVYLATIMNPDAIGGPDRAQLVRDALERSAVPLWEFARPLLQLALLLFIAKSAVEYFGQRWSLDAFGIQWDIRSLIAIIVVSVFSVAALAGSDATGALKDVALVVIGFYFGQTQLQHGRHGNGQANQGAVSVSIDSQKPD